MITAYTRHSGTLAPQPLLPQAMSPEVVWIDLLSPSLQEEKAVEALLGVNVPTREEMQEIEISNRLYQEGAALYMTVTMLLHSESATPESVPATFILSGSCLVTLRYADPVPFRIVAAQVQKSQAACTSAEEILAGFLEASVNRLADILERVQADMDGLSAKIFAKPEARGDMHFTEVLRDIGRSQSLTTRTRESLVSFSRLLSFLNQPGHIRQDKIILHSLDTTVRDIASLSDHASFLSNNINFLLDATLGMINSQQTGIIKIFSVAAVVFLPPTLIASIYGMNFHHMPELSSIWGYPVSLGLMVLSAIFPYWYFKRKGWL
ncbi:MAG: magnesium transporter CorA family protein [Alphaproteobacteria bacterium]|nr:magnesium transporter CorA family protein [Alphaproteobacteria bacterium]